MSGATTGNTRGWVALGVLALTVVAVLIAVLLVFRASSPTDEWYRPANGGEKIHSDEERHSAVAVAEQFCLRIDAIDGSDPDGYVEKVSEVLTTKQKNNFVTEFEQSQKLGLQAGLTGTGDILASGIEDMDSDSASVLVAHDATVTEGENTTQRHYRWVVELRKVGGKWLVDDFTPVT